MTKVSTRVPLLGFHVLAPARSQPCCSSALVMGRASLVGPIQLRPEIVSVAMAMNQAALVRVQNAQGENTKTSLAAMCVQNAHEQRSPDQ